MKRILILLICLLAFLPQQSIATISTTASSVTVAGNGSQNSFQFPFVADSAADLAVIYTNSSGQMTTISPTLYNVVLNPVQTGQLWSIGGQVIYPISGSPIASGTSLTIQRILPLTQATTFSNQGNFYPQVTEESLDTATMQIQQLSARGGQIRGTWLTDTIYNFGDIVQDGPSGNNTGSYYTCAASNTSGTWTTDLANGDWVLSLPATIPVATLPLSIGNGGTGQITAGAALNALGGIGLSANNTYTGANNFTGGSITVPTASAGNSSGVAASTAFVNSTPLTLASGTTAADLAVSTSVSAFSFITNGAPSSGLSSVSSTSPALFVTGNIAMTWLNNAIGVNYVQVTNAPTGNGPTMIAAGSDTNVNLTLAAKGTGNITFATGGGNQFQIDTQASAVDDVQVQGSAAGNPGTVTVTAAGSDTNINLALGAKGSGNIQAISINANTTASAANVNVDTSGNLKKSTSSRADKTDIRPWDRNALEIVENFKPYFYRGKNDPVDSLFAGAMAEDFDAQGLREFVDYDEDGKPTGLEYPHMIVIPMVAIEEQQMEIRALFFLVGTLGLFCLVLGFRVYRVQKGELQ